MNISSATNRLALLRVLTLLLMAVIAFRSPTALANTYECTAADAARLVSLRMGGSVSGARDYYSVTGVVSGKQFEIDFSRHGSCGSTDNVKVSTSQGWNGEARAAEIRAELISSVASILRSCSNSKCKSDEVEAAKQAKAAKAERLKGEIASYQSSCVDHVAAILGSGSAAISKVDVAYETKACSHGSLLLGQSEMVGLSTDDREELAADIQRVGVALKRTSVAQTIIRDWEGCFSASSGTSWSGRGAGLKLLVQTSGGEEFIAVARGMFDAFELCARAADTLQAESAADPSFESFAVSLFPLPNGMSLDDLTHCVRARNAANQKILPEIKQRAEAAVAQARWEAANCTRVCRCESTGQEVTESWGNSCPYSRAYGCREWSNWSDKWNDAHWETVRKVCD